MKIAVELARLVRKPHSRDGFPFITNEEFWTFSYGAATISGKQDAAGQSFCPNLHSKLPYFLFMNSQLFNLTPDFPKFRLILCSTGIKQVSMELFLYPSVQNLRLLATVGYCVKCKAKREMKGERQITMKNGRPAMTGTCTVCGTKMFKIGGGGGGVGKTKAKKTAKKGKGKKKK